MAIHRYFKVIDEEVYRLTTMDEEGYTDEGTIEVGQYIEQFHDKVGLFGNPLYPGNLWFTDGRWYGYRDDQGEQRVWLGNDEQ